nr:MAG: hypothetical protein [Chemarfal virus 90]
MLWPGKEYLEADASTQGPREWIARGRDVVQGQGAVDETTITRIPAIAGALNNNWATFNTAGAKEIVKSKLLGRGYLSLGESTRFTKSVKTKYLFTNERFLRDDNDTTATTWFLKRGISASLMVVYRGCARTGTFTGSIPKARMHILCSWVHDAYTDGKVQSGSIDANLYPDDYS